VTDWKGRKILICQILLPFLLHIAVRWYVVQPALQGLTGIYSVLYRPVPVCFSDLQQSFSELIFPGFDRLRFCSYEQSVLCAHLLSLPEHAFEKLNFLL